MPLKSEENILRHYSFRDKIIPNCLKINATHEYDNDLLLRQETQKKLTCSGRWYNTKKKKKWHWFIVFSLKDAFLKDVFQMTVIALVSVTNYYHINGLHLIWDILYFRNINICKK